MRLSAIFEQQHPAVSLEFFPPKSDEDAEQLFQTISEHFRPLGPSYITVTYGAGGSTRHRTRDLVVRLSEETGLTTVPHLTCIGHTRDEIGDILQTYVEHGVETVLALRGDKPTDQPDFEHPVPGGFAYANDLVAFIKKEFSTMDVGVAGYPEVHPETPNPLDDLTNLKRKVDAGADVIITQLFFDNRDYYDFVERCEIEGITVPIAAGVMPIRSIKGIRRMAGLSGARLPASLIRSLNRAGEDSDSIRAVGAHWATEQCRDLLDHNVRGIHLYTLNKSTATRRIYESLGIKHTEALHS